MEIDETVFRELNPALTEEVYSGNKFIPVGYTVRVPAEASTGFLMRYEAIPGTLKYREQRKAVVSELPEVKPGTNEAREPASDGSAAEAVNVSGSR
jgi:hypothetical protein